MDSERITLLRTHLAKCTPEELDEIRKVMSILTSGHKLTKANETAAELWYEDIRSEAATWMNRADHHWHVFAKRGQSRIVFSAAALNAEDWIKMQIKKKIERSGLRRLCANLVVLAIRRDTWIDIPFWHQVAAKLRDLPILVDQAFPGYLGSGMIENVVRVFGTDQRLKLREKTDE